ncbi:PREDICTED: uncharacterized protein LOC108764344 [Trachymyrmex cornetzi]|uniref:uncharacterized protein LOC108764344 n=1 Tax=Trachymyrmex cornetzi TaxID=471704 RepID=UPI00084EED35|nr:PREDICTED: uncharacterized protein LOC108764344 [Trachymyrmex cornetzi]
MRLHNQIRIQNGAGTKQHWRPNQKERCIALQEVRYFCFFEQVYTKYKKHAKGMWKTFSRSEQRKRDEQGQEEEMKRRNTLCPYTVRGLVKHTQADDDTENAVQQGVAATPTSEMKIDVGVRRRTTVQSPLSAIPLLGTPGCPQPWRLPRTSKWKKECFTLHPCDLNRQRFNAMQQFSRGEIGPLPVFINDRKKRAKDDDS